MKRNIATLTMLCLMNFHGISQDSSDVILQVSGLKSVNIQLLHRGNTLDHRRFDTLRLSGTAWRLVVRSAIPGFRVRIRNQEQPMDSHVLTSFSEPHTVQNDFITGSNFRIGKSFAIEVVNTATQQVIKTYNLIYSTREFASASAGTPSRDRVLLNYHVGSAVYDAQRLADKTISNSVKLGILAHYAKTKVDQAAVKKELQNNMFFDSLLNVMSVQGVQQGSFNLSSVFGTIGGLDVTNIADGFAKFLVKRAKEELNAIFFEKFQETITDPRYIDLQTIFPQTYRSLMVIGEDIYRINVFIQTLRESFENDLSTLNENLPSIISNHPDFFEARPELAAMLNSGTHIAGALADRVHPGDILKDYPVEYLDNLKREWKGSVQTIQLLSASLRDTSASDTVYWVNSKQVRKLVTDKASFKFYLGLIYQQARSDFDSIHFNDQHTLVSFLDTVARHFEEYYQPYREYIYRFGERVSKLNHLIRNYKKPVSDSLEFEQYYSYFKASIDILAYAAEISKLPYIKTKVPNMMLVLKDYFSVVNSSADLVLDIKRRNYGSAIANTVNIYSLVKAQYSPTRDDTARKLYRWGTFMASVVQAKSSDEVQNVVEAFALPSGSSRIKRETNFNVSLNGYVGPYIGYEKIKGVDSGGLNSFGITAPIGISLSKGHSVFFVPVAGKSSSSIFVSLIDLGAVTAFRFTDDSAEKIPSIELKDILSPGIFYSFGFGKTPLSLNLGYQFGPLLRKVNLDASKYEKKYSRFSVSFCVDVPIFNFYTKSNP